MACDSGRRPQRCGRFAPCLTVDTRRVSSAAYCAGADLLELQHQMLAAHGPKALRTDVNVCLRDHLLHRDDAARAGERELSELRDGGAKLRITGPVSEGFWARALVVVLHAAWATRVGLRFDVAYRSPHDNYLDADDKQRDGWTQFFEPLPVFSVGNTSRAHERRRELLVQLGCTASSRAWEGFAHYAANYRHAAAMRRYLGGLTRSLPVVPRSPFRRSAAAFWRRRGLGGQNGTLGVHLRGTDRPETKVSHARDLVPFIAAYLCHQPAARIFVATDDARMLDALREQMVEWELPTSRLVWRQDVRRGNSRLNPGVHAEKLGLRGQPSLAHDVLVDTLLLSKCDFLLRTISSSVSEFAIYFNPVLHEQSYDLTLKGQPRPGWADACRSSHLTSCRRMQKARGAPPIVLRSSSGGETPPQEQRRWKRAP